MTEMRDELLDQVVGELRTLPPVDEGAVARIIAAAALETRGAGSAQQTADAVTWWRSRVPLAAAAGFALAAGLGGYALRGGGSAPMVATTPSAAESLTLASSELAPPTSPLTLPTQFILDAPRATHVALVGDFNAWNASATPLVRVASSGIWTVTIPLAAGRHTYAFMVDGKRWTLDPRAPTAQDPEFETPSSVVLVGTP